MYSPISSVNTNTATDKQVSGRWTKEEHDRFVEGLKIFGKNWKKVEEYVATRSGAQIRSHAQKFFNRVERECNVKLDRGNGNSKNFEKTMRKISESQAASNDFYSNHNDSTIIHDDDNKSLDNENTPKNASDTYSLPM
jgi:SHAQKYF class myb-like DNA-binding protein